MKHQLRLEMHSPLGFVKSAFKTNTSNLVLI